MLHRSTTPGGYRPLHVIQLIRNVIARRTTRFEKADPGAEDQGRRAQGARASHRRSRAGLDAASGHGADRAHALLQSSPAPIATSTTKSPKPVPVDEMLRRIDHLGRLGTSIITISGGEPLTHPDLDEIIARIRNIGALAGMITNGYLLMPERIERLNKAGLDHLQISIDNVEPDEISKKSLKVLDKKLQWLSEHADFHVNINSVVGGGIKNPQDALTIGRRAIELGFTSTIGIIHDGDGQLKPLGDRRAPRMAKRCAAGRRRTTRGSTSFRKPSPTARPMTGGAGRDRAISTSARTGWCITARSSAAFPAFRSPRYTQADLDREFLTEKTCAPHCTISCVHQISYIDHWRAPQTSRISPGIADSLVKISS